jgi:predicted RNase H-like nuclease (RuvC/YqgF family)
MLCVRGNVCVNRLLFLFVGSPHPLMQHQKAIADHELKEQMEEPVVQQIQLEVNALKQKIQEYNKQQMALRARAKSIDEEKDGIASKVLIPNSYHTLL